MDNEYIYDICALDLSKRINIEKPVNYNYCVDLKNSTPATLCVGKVGTRYKTETYLRFRADQAVAKDAVWSEVNEDVIDSLGFLKVSTLAKSREEYIMNPDFGRHFSESTIEYIKDSCSLCPDIQIVAADGLSSAAINDNICDIYSIIKDLLNCKEYKIGTPIFVKYGEPAVVNKLSEILTPKITILFIGERPSFTSFGSMNTIISFEGKDSEREEYTISNIHKQGTPAVEAGAQIVDIIEHTLI